MRAATPTVWGSQTFPQRALYSDKPGQREVFLAASESQQLVKLVFPCASYNQRFFEDLEIRLERSTEYQRIQKSIALSVQQPWHNGWNQHRNQIKRITAFIVLFLIL